MERNQLVSGAACVVVSLVLGCGASDSGVTDGGEPRLQATIRRTQYGIPHITADSWSSLGLGQGYALAEDRLCALADQVIKVRSQRARYFGAGVNDANLDSDFALLALDIYATARSGLSQQPQPVVDLIAGFVRGYNRYLQDAGAPEPCRGAPWVGPIDSVDVLAHLIDLGLINVEHPLLPAIARAQPPGASALASPPVALADLGLSGRAASNAWAIGAELSEHGGGMLLANPHLPWVGELKLHEVQLTIPGQLNVYGASLAGMPGVGIGFNESVAWTFTDSQSIPVTLYTLALVPGQPTHYLIDGVERTMTTRELSVQVLDGATLATRTRTLYASEHGPIVSMAPLVWSATQAVAMRSVNSDNVSALAQLVRMMTAGSLDELKAAHELQGLGWANTVATDAGGRTWYMDGSRVPHLGVATLTSWSGRVRTDPFTALLARNHLAMLDGTTARDIWLSDSGGGYPHIEKRAPQLERGDFVFNANESYWLTNPAQLLGGFSRLYGPVGLPLFPRTRRNLSLLTDRRPEGPWGADSRVSLAELEAAALDNRGSSAELLRAAVVAHCRTSDSVVIDGVEVAIAAACQALDSWDGTHDLGARGAAVWREFLAIVTAAGIPAALGERGLLFADDFDPMSPVTTPNTPVAPPASGPDPVLIAFGRAVQALTASGVAVDTAVGDLQYQMRRTTRVPVHGCTGAEGCMNVIDYLPGLDTTLLPRARRTQQPGVPGGVLGGGLLFDYGSTFVMAVELTSGGPRAEAVMVYSQSDTAGSPHFDDQTQLWSAKQWRPVLFKDDDVKADPQLAETVVTD
jgi:acyl-homoserine-lactone acylase